MANQNVERNKLSKKLRRLVGRAVVDHSMIEEGDRVMVCLSGGKDSYTLLDVLRSLQRNAPVRFTLFALNLDQKQPGFPADVLPRYLDGLDVEYHIVEEDTFSIVRDLTPEGKTFCPICSRLRRGVLYKRAGVLGATKIALGHHLDDAVETLFLNMFFGSKLKSMPPKLLSDDGAHVVIRPLYYVRERDIARYSEYQQHPIIPCNLCGSQEHLQRQVVKEMCQQWDQIQPGRVENIARAMQNVVPSHLADANLFDFAGLKQQLRLLRVAEQTEERY
ncbi:MAG: tRNA 2-thiocytidine(32) synthetase TtcA [Pseudomonadota bacterium]|mgnify:FL=1|uniref:tRNA(Ile)-lysidine/2-thiocytidine synthase N-terminal domain-containing protein n=1 Tax=marine metagenome TaxID=408172 RepID=A0A381PIB4_9ZZZZ|nr:tRNA 2-thiocytidine(32) synthetase TtcA [Pseudomonadota bacterium]MEC8868488.1 tRNA 2-thiocytidine(32) synthetase TtcA [Pseudomonadota bacterium]MEE3182872.1 tRNA 2-thiocytidine(32) synthetase TtcA [Pseudomonadota bacterium]HBP15386.1 tRNA 2-thiocytidine(32) synthetase TtcA [Gammaproteobacteria bacterium]|tara:strand:+ start:515 stop:1342 length:828 start_codon:yes stop_codon:yes gene_type:complete